MNCLHCNNQFYAEQNRLKTGRGKFCSLSCKRKAGHSIGSKIKMSKAKKGKPVPKRQGKNCHFWRGGITPINKKDRMSLDSRLWREAIYQRNDYTCQICGQRGGKLQADHIKPFSLFPELRFAIDNGRTLCIDCHKTTDTYGWKILNYKKLNDNPVA